MAHEAFKKIHMGEEITDEELEALFDSFYVKPEKESKPAYPVIDESLYQQQQSKNAEWSHIIIPSIEIEIVNHFSHNPELLFNIPPRKFEEIIAAIFKNQGFDVELTPQTRDGGFDILAIHKNSITGETSFLVECKRYAPKNKVGIGTIQRMFGVIESLQANKGIIVTTSSFTKDATLFAQRAQHKLALNDYNNIKSWLNQFKNR